MAHPSNTPQDTEALLHGLIVECGDIIRSQLRPGLEAENDPDTQWGYARAVSDLVKIAALAGEAVARLRGHGGETTHRIIVQRLGEGRG